MQSNECGYIKKKLYFKKMDICYVGVGLYTVVCHPSYGGILFPILYVNGTSL